MHHPHDSTSPRTTRFARTVGLAALALGLTFTAVPAIAHAGPPDPPLDWQVYGDSYHIG